MAAARARGACLPWRRGSWVQVLACPGGTWSERSCLPWRRVLGLSPRSPWRRVWCAMVLLAREEVWLRGLACPGGGTWGHVLLALEENGPSVLACPGGGTGGMYMSCWPGRRLGVPAGLSSSRVGRVGDGVGCGAWRALCWEKDANKEDDIRKVGIQ